MTRETALAIVEQLMTAATAHDASRVAALYADHAIAVSPVFGEVVGRKAIAGTWQTLFNTFEEVVVEVTDVLVDGDRVAVLSTVSTIDRVGWFGLPATGGPIRYRLVLLLTMVDGRIVRDERLYDSSGVIERLEKARLDKELRTAADVQRALMPRTAHVSAFCESVGNSVPCRAIGGDFFEFFDLPSGNVGVAMGDVSGKGPAAALLAAMLQGLFAAEAPVCRGPAATLARVNQQLSARCLEPRFATLVYAVLSPGGHLTYSNAGHNPPALLTTEGVHRLTTGGPILSTFPDAAFQEEDRLVRSGDMLVMFTDGVTEARNPTDEEFGEDRLLACVTVDPRSTPMAMLTRIFDAVRAFGSQAEQSDDVTVTVTRFR